MNAAAIPGGVLLFSLATFNGIPHKTGGGGFLTPDGVIFSNIIGD